jgi:hypothetical protein
MHLLAPNNVTPSVEEPLLECLTLKAFRKPSVPPKPAPTIAPNFETMLGSPFRVGSLNVNGLVRTADWINRLCSIMATNKLDILLIQEVHAEPVLPAGSFKDYAYRCVFSAA